MYHDSLEFTKQENLRISISLAVSEDVYVDGKIGNMVISQGKYAIGHFEIDDPSDHANAWNYIYDEWSPNSGFQPEDGYVFEMYMNDPNTHTEKKHFLDIYMLIKSM
nr:GyrI-like domain-containing protein [Clostridium sp. UBA2485]